MDSRITITKEEEIRVSGRPTYKDNDFYTCWAEILDLIGNELYQAINIKLENTVTFKVRYCKKLEELRDKSKFKVMWQCREYAIYTVDFMGYDKKSIKIKCKLVT